ncbi:MAG: MFS transporter [Methyloligellaceae bacterium]
MRSRSYLVIVLAAGLIIGLSMGTRQTFGLFQVPMTSALGIGRADFALSLALLNILWGLAQPVAGMIADKYGPVRLLMFGTVLYVFGTWLMAHATSALDLHIGAGLCVGFGTAATGFSVVFGAISRTVEPKHRTMALGIASTGGSVGQFILLPVGQELIDGIGWSGALIVLAAIAACMAPLALAFAAPRGAHAGTTDGRTAQPLTTAISEAFGDRSFLYLNLGFAVCGFQVLFIAAHFPAYVQDLNLSARTGALALGMIAFTNIFGTYLCSLLATRYPRKLILSSMYFLRALVVGVMLVLPKNEITLLAIAAALGLLWLGTVPLTSDLVGHIFGVRYLGSLFGIVFLAHQIGGFVGVWAGGVIFDATQSYDWIWYGCIALGIVAGLLHLPIKEQPLMRVAAQRS